jgi:hypothetical protein
VPYTELRPGYLAGVGDHSILLHWYPVQRLIGKLISATPAIENQFNPKGRGMPPQEWLPHAQGGRTPVQWRHVGQSETGWCESSTLTALHSCKSSASMNARTAGVRAVREDASHTAESASGKTLMLGLSIPYATGAYIARNSIGATGSECS